MSKKMMFLVLKNLQFSNLLLNHRDRRKVAYLMSPKINNGKVFLLGNDFSENNKKTKKNLGREPRKNKKRRRKQKENGMTVN